MVKITITPTTLFFDDISDEILMAIDERKLELHTAPKGYRVSGTKENLYLLLVEIAKDFDIEIDNTSIDLQQLSDMVASVLNRYYVAGGSQYEGVARYFGFE